MTIKLLTAVLAAVLMAAAPTLSAAGNEAGGHEGHGHPVHAGDAHKDGGREGHDDKDGHEGRGDRDVHDDHEEAPDTVTVSTRSQALAGIVTVRSRAGAAAPSFKVTGRIVQDARALFHVRAGTAGRFTAAAVLGQPVRKDDVLGAVVSGEERAELRAPAQGAVSGLAAADGAEVRPGEIVLTVTGNDPVWAVLDVPERELPRLESGSSVLVRASAWPGRSFEGEIEFVAPEVDEVSRTIKTRARLANPGGLLKFGLFITAEVRAPGGGAAVSVPTDALQRFEDGWVVFVRTAPDRFQARPVRPGAERDGRTVILSGLRAGETVAVKGAFLLKSELMKEQIGGHSH